MRVYCQIQQQRAIDLGLNYSQALLYDYLLSAQEWATQVEVNGEVFYNVSNNKICDDLPIIARHADTAYRLVKQLERLGLVKRITIAKRGYVAFIEPVNGGKVGNVGNVGNGSGISRKTIRDNSENPPTNSINKHKNIKHTPEAARTDNVFRLTPVSVEQSARDDNPAPVPAKPVQKKTDRFKRVSDERIQELFNTILGPKLHMVKKLHAKRSRLIAARIKEDEKRCSADWWERYFNAVSNCAFLCGETGGRNGEHCWSADFDWLLNESNLTKVIEGRYA